MDGLMDQIIRVLKLDPAFFEEVVDDPGTGKRSWWVLALFAMAASVGMFQRAGGMAVNIGLITTLISFYVWSFSTYYVGAYFFSEPGAPKDRRSLMRAMRFSTAPGILRILGLIPSVGGIAFIVTAIWMVSASALGVQRALGLSTVRKAVAISMGCWFVSTLLQGVLMVMAFNAFGIKGG